MSTVAGFAELIAWVAGSIAVSCIIFGLGVRAAKTVLWLRAEHRRRLERDRDHIAQEAWHEHIGKHRAAWDVPLDDMPAEIIAAVVTSVKNRRPR